MEIHDYRQSEARWGWSLDLIRIEDGNAYVMGVGRNINVGDYLAVNVKDEVLGLRVDAIKYHTNPDDLYEATCSGYYKIEMSENL